MAQQEKYFIRQLSYTLALAIIGFVIHNFREFGFAGLFAMEAATIPWSLIGIAGLLAWVYIPQARKFAALFLIFYAALNLIGGGILSVLPLSIFPFEPEQSISHYISHVIYGVSQIPLIWLCIQSFSLKEAKNDS